MKKQSLKMLSVFIIVMMILSIIPEMVDAQKKCPKGHCPKGFSCVDGYCLPSGHGGGGGGGGCNCNVRPVPFSCGQICGFLAGQTPEINLLSISSNNSFE